MKTMKTGQVQPEKVVVTQGPRRGKRKKRRRTQDTNHVQDVEQLVADSTNRSEGQRAEPEECDERALQIHSVVRFEEARENERREDSPMQPNRTRSGWSTRCTTRAHPER